MMWFIVKVLLLLGLVELLWKFRKFCVLGVELLGVGGIGGMVFLII